MFTNCNLLLESMSEAILMLDKSGYITYANSAASTITGYDVDELINMPLAAFYTYNLSENHIKADYELSVAFKTKKFVSEGWRLRKDSSKLWTETILAPVIDDQLVHRGFSCIIRDISNKKQQELELRLSEERYRLMIDGVQEYSIFMIDPQGYILTWNDGAKRIKGYNFKEVIGKHFSMFYTAEDLESKKHEKELRIAVESGKYEEEGWRVKKNGSVFWANIVLTPLYNEFNKHIGFSKVTRDLTEKKEKEEVLRLSEERYRMLVEQVTDYGIFMMDEKGRIINWNEGARRIKGYAANEIIGKYFSIFYPEEDILNGKPAYELKVAIEVGKYEEEGWRLRKDGTRFWANVVITAVYDKKGTHVGFSKVTRDLTERKNSERILKESYEKYRFLSEELKITNSELSYANQELEQFTSIVSHDLQEPVRSIKSFLQIIDLKLSAQDYEAARSYIAKAINSASRMKELIQNLLNYSQLSKNEINTEEILVADLIQEVLQNLRTQIDHSSAQVIVNTSITTIYGDRVQLSQLLQNLVSNALKFTNVATPSITIKCTTENDHPKFSIKDNGIGIEAADMPKIFEIFRRLHTIKEYPGTGIGLAICKKIVDRHKGRIWPESEKGQGTTFHFTLNEDIQQEVLSYEEI